MAEAAIDRRFPSGRKTTVALSRLAQNFFARSSCQQNDISSSNTSHGSNVNDGLIVGEIQSPCRCHRNGGCN